MCMINDQRWNTGFNHVNKSNSGSTLHTGNLDELAYFLLLILLQTNLQAV